MTRKQRVASAIYFGFYAVVGLLWAGVFVIAIATAAKAFGGWLNGALATFGLVGGLLGAAFLLTWAATERRRGANQSRFDKQKKPGVIRPIEE